MGVCIRLSVGYIAASGSAMQPRAVSSSMKSSNTTMGVAPRRRKTSCPRPSPSRSFRPRRFRRSANSFGNMDGRIVAVGIYLTSQLLTGSVMPMTILKELKQTRPFPSPSQEAAVALLRTADVVNRLIDSVVAGHGITGQQYNVLRILRGAGERGLPTLDIAERMIEQTPGIRSEEHTSELQSRGLISY